MTLSYFVGLDLGQTTNFSALAVLEKSFMSHPTTKNKRVSRYAVRHLHRWPLGTKYPAIVTDVAELVGKPPLRDCVLAVDQTGVGRPVVDLLAETPMPASLKAITITAGTAVTRADDGGWHVPKKELVSTLQVLLQGQRMKFARELPLVEILVKELANFKVKITLNANETFGAWREGQYDDLVLALAIGSWAGEHLAGRPFTCASAKPSGPRAGLTPEAIRRHLGRQVWGTGGGAAD